MRKIGNRRWLSECCFVPGPATGQLPIVSLCHGMSICPAARLRYVNIKLRRGPHVYIGPAEENRLSLQRLSFPRPKKKKMISHRWPQTRIASGNDLGGLGAKKKSQRQLAGRVKGARAVKSFYSKKNNNTNSHERKWMVCFFHPAATTHETAIPCMDIYYFQKGKKETQPPRHKKHQPRRSVSTRRSTVSFLSFWPPQTKQTLIITMARARLTDPSYSVIFERERRVEGRKEKDNNSTASTSRGYLLSPPL